MQIVWFDYGRHYTPWGYITHHTCMASTAWETHCISYHIHAEGFYLIQSFHTRICYIKINMLLKICWEILTKFSENERFCSYFAWSLKKSCLQNRIIIIIIIFVYLWRAHLQSENKNVYVHIFYQKWKRTNAILLDILGNIKWSENNVKQSLYSYKCCRLKSHNTELGI